MEFNNRKQALLYLDRNGIYFYEAGMSNIVSMAFLPTSVRDLDLIDSKSLESQIQAFSTQAKITPSNISIIISPNLIFEKNIMILDPIKQKEEIDKFVGTIPFDNVSTQFYPIEKGVKVVGVNEDLYMSIKNAFDKLGSTTNTVLPFTSLGADASLLSNFTIDNIMTLLKRLDKLKQFSLIANKEKPQVINTSAGESNHQNTESHKTNKRIYLMAGFFVVLLLILGYMLTTL